MKVHKPRLANGNNNNNNNNGSDNNNDQQQQIVMYQGPSVQEKKQVAQLMESTETLMKFGFMSMSMTYFSSLNMVQALRTVAAQDTVMAAVADNNNQKAMQIQNGMNVPPNGSGGGGVPSGQGPLPFSPDLRKGQLPGQEALRVTAWSVADVAKWLQTLSLGQYSEAFIDAGL